jgi:hypothetical protein
MLITSSLLAYLFYIAVSLLSLSIVIQALLKLIDILGSSVIGGLALILATSICLAFFFKNKANLNISVLSTCIFIILNLAALFFVINKQGLYINSSISRFSI